MLDEISCTISNRMPSEKLNEWTQALDQRFGISGGHPSEPPSPSKRKLLYQRFGISGGHSPEPPGLSECKLYIRDLAYQGDTPLNPPARANATFISKGAIIGVDDWSAAWDPKIGGSEKYRGDVWECDRPWWFCTQWCCWALYICFHCSTSSEIFWLFCSLGKYAFLMSSLWIGHWCFAEHWILESIRARVLHCEELAELYRKVSSSKVSKRIIYMLSTCLTCL